MKSPNEKQSPGGGQRPPPGDWNWVAADIAEAPNGLYSPQETDLYYLQSRYYDPKVGRFINADAYASTGQGIIGYNMFIYCLNNPVRCVDSDGRKAEDATDTEEDEDDDGYRFVGIGFQGELDVGAYEVGFEIIVFFDPLVCGGEEPVVAVYTYEGAFADIDDFMKSTAFQQTVAKLALTITTNAIDEQNAEALLIALQQALFNDIGVSGSVVGIFGNSEFDSTNSYAGPFNAFSGTIHHVKVTYAYCSSCFSIAIGGSTDKIAASYGQSYYTQVY